MDYETDTVVNSTSKENETIEININTELEDTNAIMDGFAIGYRSPMQRHSLLSPGQVRSVREFEEQMDSLRKENFNLKLKIYVLEEKLPAIFSHSKEDDPEILVRECLEAKVENETLRNDLEEKRELLKEAAQAINHLENIQKESEERNALLINDLNLRIQCLEHENKLLEKNYSKCQDSLSSDDLKITPKKHSRLEITQNEMRVSYLETSIKKSQEKITELSSQIQKMEDIITKKNNEIEGFNKIIRDLKEKNLEFKDNIDEKEKLLSNNDTNKLQKELDKYKAMLADKMCELDIVQENFAKQKEDHQVALKYIEKMVKVANVLKSENNQLKKESDKENETNNISNKSVDGVKNALPESNKKLNSKIEILSKQLEVKTKELESKNVLIEKLKTDLNENQLSAQKMEKWTQDLTNICNLLTTRLEELASFLDSLLKHKTVLAVISNDKKLKIQEVINKSLDITRSLNSNSLSISNISFNESHFTNLSNITGLLDNTYFDSSKFDYSSLKNKSKTREDNLMNDLKSKLNKYKSQSKISSEYSTLDCTLPLKSTNLEQSESEEFSEPDKNESRNRIGLEASKNLNLNMSKYSSTDNSLPGYDVIEKEDENKNISELNNKIFQYEKLLIEKDNKILEIQCRLVESDNQLKKQNMLVSENAEEHAEKVKTLQNEIEILKETMKKSNILKDEKEKLLNELKAKDEQLNELNTERNILLLKIKDSEKLVDDLKYQIEELVVKYEYEMELIKNNELKKVEILNENLKNMQLKYQEDLKENWISIDDFINIKTEKLNLETELIDSKKIIETLNINKQKSEEKLQIKMRSLEDMQTKIDENLVTISRVTLDRTKLINEKTNLEKCLKDLMENCEKLKHENNSLNKKLENLLNYKENNLEKNSVNSTKPTKNDLDYENVEVLNELKEKCNETNVTHASMNLNINLENNVNNEEQASNDENKSKEESSNNVEEQLPNHHKCKEIFKQNIKLRNLNKKLNQEIKKYNKNAEHVEQAVVQEIEKTHDVLKNVRINLKKQTINCDKQNDSCK